jgi:hypothetical protein
LGPLETIQIALFGNNKTAFWERRKKIKQESLFNGEIAQHGTHFTRANALDKFWSIMFEKYSYYFNSLRNLEYHQHSLCPKGEGFLAYLV